MIESSKYWNYATVAALSIGFCNALPNYMDFFLSATMFSNFSLFWKMATSFLILMYVGKHMVAQETEYTYGQSFKWCFLCCLLSALAEGFLSILYVKVIDPGYMEKIHNMAMQVLESSHAYNQEMLDAANKTMTSLFSPSGILLTTVITAAFCGAIMSLIAAAAIKKNPDYSQEDEDE